MKPNRMHEPEVPEKAPHNPYRSDVTFGAGPAGPLEEPRAKGLDGDLLDSLLKSRMVEGMRMGHAEGYQDASRRYPDIFDEGYRAGVGQGIDIGCAQMGELAEPMMKAFGRAQAQLIGIAAKARKDSFTQRSADSALESLQEGLNLIRSGP